MGLACNLQDKLPIWNGPPLGWSLYILHIDVVASFASVGIIKKSTVCNAVTTYGFVFSQVICLIV